MVWYGIHQVLIQYGVVLYGLVLYVVLLSIRVCTVWYCKVGVWYGRHKGNKESLHAPIRYVWYGKVLYGVVRYA